MGTRTEGNRHGTKIIKKNAGIYIKLNGAFYFLTFFWGTLLVWVCVWIALREEGVVEKGVGGREMT